MFIILKFLLSVLVITALILVLPGVKTEKFYRALIVAVTMTIINMLIAPLFEYFNVPFTALGFGLLIVFLNSLLIWLFGGILKGFKVDGFGWAFVFALILSVIIYIIELVFEPGYFEVF